MCTGTIPQLYLLKLFTTSSTLFCSDTVFHVYFPRLIWATSWQNQQNDLCAQWNLRSAWASAQSDQSLRCPHAETLSYPLCTQRRLWSESSLCAEWVAKDPSFLHAHSEDSDPAGRMSRLIWDFAGRTSFFFFLVLSCRGSYFLHKRFTL